MFFKITRHNNFKVQIQKNKGKKIIPFKNWKSQNNKFKLSGLVGPSKMDF